MKDPRISVRYLGFKALGNGGRQLDFSFARSDGSIEQISVTAVSALFGGPDGITIQECPAICYETLKCYAQEAEDTLPESITLTPADIAQHRKYLKTAQRRPHA